MINNKKVLGIIPARGGSKGVPRKNICEIAGKPLIAWTIEAGNKSEYIDRLIVTSDDLEIIGVAKEYGCDVPFIRPQQLAQDTTPGIDPVLHAIDKLPDYDYIVLLQPTSPLRMAEDIDGSIEKMMESDAPSCVSVTKVDKSPYWMYSLQENNHMQLLIPQEKVPSRRQDLSDAFVVNGAVYVAESKWLLNNKSFLRDETVAFVMPKSRSYDIDTEEDFILCEALMRRSLIQE
ncbi:cytidylyltransferase domain-containing protein [Paenibacillus sp. PL91]|uniref:acylneuraminate cytidylyltransferase family protein n=1 Tax=Paenibacillus sp. PL91 TaxID=2729538 RepID=UPI00145DC3F7|nr:acylneuraminate cytidylyltransferase family protein [Paenibacillus sp. PL91]MBC9201918.1 acylneuraminate cytidylyltransferase family protein [Paenibacillus sp. PL91]